MALAAEVFWSSMACQAQETSRRQQGDVGVAAVTAVCAARSAAVIYLRRLLRMPHRAGEAAADDDLVRVERQQALRREGKLRAGARGPAEALLGLGEQHGLVQVRGWRAAKAGARLLPPARVGPQLGRRRLARLATGLAQRRLLLSRRRRRGGAADVAVATCANKGKHTASQHDYDASSRCARARELTHTRQRASERARKRQGRRARPGPTSSEPCALAPNTTLKITFFKMRFVFAAALRTVTKRLSRLATIAALALDCSSGGRACRRQAALAGPARALVVARLARVPCVSSCCIMMRSESHCRRSDKGAQHQQS